MLKLHVTRHWSPDVKRHSLEKTLMLGKIEGRRRRGMTEDEMVGWHHPLNAHDFEPTLGDSEREVRGAAVQGVTKSQTRLNN